MALKVPTIFSAVDKFSGPVGKMSKSAEASMSRMSRSLNRIGDSAFDVSKKTAIMGTAIIVPLAIVTKSAVDFEDKLADIGKTTGLEGEKLAGFGDEILNLSKKTRTSIDDLAKIGEIGGQLGIAEEDLLSFTAAADQFNIALGADFSGGVEEAISSIGKIKNLFEETRDLNVADSIIKTGSAINELGARGAGTSQNIADFTLRLGALPDALKPSIENTLALGTFLEEVGISSERGASGLTKILLVAGQNLSKFASQMGITKQKASELLAEDPTKFVTKFATSFEGLAPEVLASKLQQLKIGSQEAIKVIGALGSGTERLAELQIIASEAFEEGNSLQEEAAKKNETMAAKMAIAKNNMQALSITLGNTLIPILGDLLESVSPMIESFSNWIKQNPGMVSSIAKLAVKAAALMFAISGVSLVIGVLAKIMTIGRFAVAAYNIVLGIMGALQGTASIAIGRSNVALKSYSVTTKIVTVLTKLWGLAMKFALGPIGSVIIAIAAVTIAVIALSSAFSKQSTAQRLNDEVSKRALENTIDQRVEVSSLFQALRRAEEGTTVYTNALNRLEEIQPGIIEKHNLTVKSLDAISAAEKELTKNILKRAKVEALVELQKEKIKEATIKEQEGAGFFEKLFQVSTLGLVNAEELNQAQVVQLETEAEILAQQQASLDLRDQQIQTAIVGAKEQGISQELIIKFEGLPENVQADVIKQSTSGGGFIKPNVSTTTG